jgi:hypothetical protein
MGSKIQGLAASLADALLAGMAVFFMLGLLCTGAFLQALPTGHPDPLGTVLILFKPCVLAAATGGMLLVRVFGRNLDLRYVRAAGGLVCIAAFIAQAAGPLGFRDVLERGPMQMLPVLITTAALLALSRLRARTPARDALLAALALCCGAGALALLPSQGKTQANRLGLASTGENRTYVEDFSQRTYKDHYPVCRFENNSLGFRDIEPSFAPQDGRTRILLIGDSYIWGDGIPANGGTLGYRLREELERRAPGRFIVMSAAYPGLGVYGYSRFIDAIAPLFKADMVVVGYLGLSDRDPADAQVLLDALPADRLGRNLVLNLGIAQHVHEVSSARWVRGGQDAPAYFSGLYAEIARKAITRGYRLIFLSYAPRLDCPLPSPIEVLDLPQGWQYPGQASELWYAKDFHPKPKLNSLLAEYLARVLLQKRPHRDAGKGPG